MVPAKPPDSPAQRLLRGLIAVPLAIWMGLALALRLPGPGTLAAGLGIGLPLMALVLLVRLPPKRGITCFAAPFLVVLSGFLALRPSNTRDWMPDVAKIPSGILRGDQLILHNVRNCHYRSEADYKARFEDRVYDLAKLQALDLFLVSWGPRHIGHVMLSFDFGNGEHLVFSIETRKERQETYSSLRGFFREYELCIVAGDERDLVRLRTNLRKESVRLYPLNTPPPVARRILRDYIARLNELSERSEWYNALTDNCTTAMIGPVHHHSDRLPWSWKLLANGHLDEFLYDHGFVNRSLPFETLRQRALINGRAMLADQDPAFSTRIREGSPDR